MTADKPVHPICGQLRSLRRASGLTFTEAAELTGVTAIALGSYERGDRLPPMSKVETILGAYGYRLVAVPIGVDPVVRLPGDLAAQLRQVADLIERTAAFSGIQPAGSR